ncbi:MAG TPA: succinate dehydrogenase cytochrome b subunit [Gemmatimonadaceae bacterium]|nr:succinate dehydrogenase cytochrome b subunit [Gemmatimonadaceae bacterium]
MRSFLRTNLGLKVIMAVTGLIMVGYLITHVLANLLVFRGPELINKYSAMLHAQPAFLWFARSVLIVALIAHVWSAIELTRRDRVARPVGYGKWSPQVSTFASRTIRWGGLLILFFLVWHILQFTTGTVQPAPFVEGDPHGNVVRAFRIPWVVALYVVSMAAVGLHLFHGTWSAFRSLGLVKASQHPLRHRTSLLVAGAIWLGFTIIPLAIFAGVGR